MSATHPTTENTPRRNRTRVLIGVGITVLAVPTLLTAIHYSLLRYRIDPLGGLAETVRLAAAGDDVEKAHAHISIAEAKLRDFEALRKRSPNSPELSPLATAMVYHDRQAMVYMDHAKDHGHDLHKLQLVDRLCDSLSDQDKALHSANKQLNDLHVFAKAVYTKVENGEDIASAMNEVKQSLNQAMSW